MNIYCKCGGCDISYELSTMHRICIPEVNISIAFVCNRCYEYYLFQYDTAREI